MENVRPNMTCFSFEWQSRKQSALSLEVPLTPLRKSARLSPVGSSSEDSGEPSLPPTTCRPAHTTGEHLYVAWGIIHRAPADHFTVPIPLVSCFLISHFHFTPTTHLVVFAQQQTSTSPDQTINISRLQQQCPTQPVPSVVPPFRVESLAVHAALYVSIMQLSYCKRSSDLMIRPALSDGPVFTLNDLRVHRPSSCTPRNPPQHLLIANFFDHLMITIRQALVFSFG